MVRAICEYNSEKINKMSRTFMRKAFRTAILFSIAFIVLGGITIYFGLKTEKQGLVSVILGGIIVLASAYPIISTIKTQRRNHKETVKAMQLDKGDLQIDMLFKEKRLEVTTSQAGEVQTETILLRNVTNVKVNKQGVAIYIEEDMYFIFNDEIVMGTQEELLRIFNKVKVPVKKRR
ncbi:MAG: hypothetical protein J6V66_04885 [Clostridia bacterium]|nr:hypothetical protein [Clostridia bacterium]